MIDVEAVIASIEAEKKSRGIYPSYAIMEEIKNKVFELMKSDINQLVTDGEVKWYKTLNSIAFEINSKS